jgi:hypothetical protein
MEQAGWEWETAVWAAAEGLATPAQVALLEGDASRWRLTLERLIVDTEDALDSVIERGGPERDQAVADFEGELARLEAAWRLLTRTNDPKVAVVTVDPDAEVRLQASWANGSVVVWAAAPAAPPASADELSDRLESIGGPAVGWTQHPPVLLPTGARAAALSIPVGEALGWLVAIGGGLGRDGVGQSVLWLGRLAVTGVRLVAAGAVVPGLKLDKRADGRTVDAHLRWSPALIDRIGVDELAGAMPGPITALGGGDARVVTLDVLGAVIDTVCIQAGKMLELPAPPPVTRTTSAVAEALITRLDGSTFVAPVSAGAEVSKRMERWASAVTKAQRPRLVVQLDPPDSGDAWFLQVLGPGAEGHLLPIEVALGDSKSTKPLADELVRLERLFPVLLRPGASRRGQVYLSQPEAWELMTETGATLESAGFEIRVPALSRRKPSPSLRLFTEPAGE